MKWFIAISKYIGLILGLLFIISLPIICIINGNEWIVAFGIIFAIVIYGTILSEFLTFMRHYLKLKVWKNLENKRI